MVTLEQYTIVLTKKSDRRRKLILSACCDDCLTDVLAEAILQDSTTEIKAVLDKYDAYSKREIDNLQGHAESRAKWEIEDREKKGYTRRQPRCPESFHVSKSMISHW
jgi:hypothetical protein